MDARLLDTHCHVSRYRDPVAVVRDAEAAGVSVVAMTEEPDEYRRLRTRLGGWKNVTVALGLHPLRAATFAPSDLARFFRLVPQATWIGEVGLDFSPVGVATKRQQMKVFDVILSEAQPGQHPLSVHSRGAERDVVRLLADAALPAVLHWYSGPINLVDEALAAGLYFSFNIAMVRSKKFGSLAKTVPLERVLLETDGPYAKSAGGPAQPGALAEVVRDIGHAWNLPPETVSSTIINNQLRLLAGTGT